ncbi:hypothetical protein GPJ56_000972 [Histomonas meleagridis]|uniref:uncharacterized protein n=1 Tax=Histomonas meleagridis TaxID=135588 RepID=UPI003559D643|nr:hypothetical protein GPJ56_000972 [Histomonas meleagridis]KAH0803809.1 hypothetical protein GO595_002639 [Histomonas meleagridis]
MSGKTNHEESLFDKIANTEEFNPHLASEGAEFKHCSDMEQLDQYQENLKKKYKDIKAKLNKSADEVPKFPEFDDGFNYKKNFYDKNDKKILNRFGQDSLIYIMAIQERAERRANFKKIYDKYREKYDQLLKEHTKDQKLNAKFSISESSEGDYNISEYSSDEPQHKDDRRKTKIPWSKISKSQVFPKDLVDHINNPNFENIIEKQLIKTKDGHIVRVISVDKADSPYTVFDKPFDKKFQVFDFVEDSERTLRVDDFSSERFTQEDFDRIREDYNPKLKDLNEKIEQLHSLRNPTRDPSEEKDLRYNMAISGQITSLEFLESVLREQKKILFDLNALESPDEKVEESIKLQNEKVAKIKEIIHSRNSFLQPQNITSEEANEENNKQMQTEEKHRRMQERAREHAEMAKKEQQKITSMQQKDLLKNAFGDDAEEEEDDDDITF